MHARDIGSLENAESAARRGLRLEPESGIRSLGHYVLADVYRRAGRLEEAERLESETEG
jgi:hypothetical protein